MKTFSLTALYLGIWIGFSAANAQEENITLNHSSTGCSLNWIGENQRSYFIQWSTDLNEFTYFPAIRSGSGALISHGFQCSAPKFFTRIRWSDIPDGGDVNTADFDGDGVPNLFELSASPQSDPLDGTSTGGDTDGDGLKDHWERFYFGNLTLADPAAVTSADGLTNKDKSDLGLDPNINYSQSSSALTSTYTYDLVGRLISVSGSLVSQTLTLDEEGNILTSD